MKYLFIFYFFTICSSGFSQSITAPAPLTIESNATNVDAGNFVIAWPSAPANILVSLSLDYHLEATLSLPTTTGLTLNTGYSSWSNIKSIVFYGNLTSINNALAAMTVSMGAVKTAIKINIEIAAYDASFVYNPTNKHYYKYVTSSAVSYASAKSGASGTSFKGKTGYLLTITSQSEQDFINNNISGNNIWIAATDAENEGIWKIDAGPENGTIFWQSTVAYTNTMVSVYSEGSTSTGQYSNWSNGEPNNADGNNSGEDHAVAKWNNGNGWNDLAAANNGGVQGYVVEISADFPAGAGYTEMYSSYVVHNNEKAFTKSSSTGITSSSISNTPNLFGGLQINDGHTITLRAGHALNTNRIDLNGSAKVVFTDANSKWTPGSPNLSNSYIHSPKTNINPAYWDRSSVYDYNDFSSSAATYYTPYLNSERGWSALSSSVGEYIILSTEIPKYIAGIVTQARAYNFSQWVKSAKIEYSLNGSDYFLVTGNLTLNNNNTEAVTAPFPSVVFAKYIKVSPTDWEGFMSIRLGLIVKSNNIVSDGLALHLDAGNLSSYIGNGSAWKDLSGNSTDATINNITYNPSGGYFEFNGSNSYATFSANIGDPSVVTVEMWVKVTNYLGMLFGFNYYNAWTAGGNLGYNTASGDQFGISSTQVTALGVLNKWKHFVFVMNKGTTIGNKIYVNGVNQLMNNNVGAERVNATFNSGVGRLSSWGAGNDWPVSMHLGNFRVYKRELTQQEISDNFDAQRARFGL